MNRLIEISEDELIDNLPGCFLASIKLLGSSIEWEFESDPCLVYEFGVKGDATLSITSSGEEEYVYTGSCVSLMITPRFAGKFVRSVDKCDGVIRIEFVHPGSSDHFGVIEFDVMTVDETGIDIFKRQALTDPPTF